MKYKIIAFDLDGTLLNDTKEIPEENLRMLHRAAECGVQLVPATGRIYPGLPEQLRALPFVRYCICVNGAQVYDAWEKKVICRAEIPAARAIELAEFMDGLPVIYDCYQDNWGWMTRSMQENAAAFVPFDYALRMVRSLRTPVEELKAYLRGQNRGVQKLQLFTPDDVLRGRLLKDLTEQFDSLSVSTSMPCNIEINDAHANKGEAIASLAAYLGLPMAATMAIGDGLNDTSMIKMAGRGVAMANACPEILAIADEVTASCDEDGAALAIERHCIPGKA